MLMFVAMGGCGFFAIIAESIYWTLLASVVGYTAAVMLYGFARNKNGIQSFLFTCPVVVSQYPRLVKRHATFLAVLIVIVTIAVKFNPNHSGSQPTSRGIGASQFFLVGISIAALALTEILTNRGVLERAHSDRFGNPPEADDFKNDNMLSIAQRD